MEPTCAIGLPHHRTIVALGIEKSTNRTDSVEAELRNKIYDLFDAALCSAGIHRRHRDRFIDRGDGILALIHPVDKAPKTILLNRVIPALSRLLADYNASLPRASRAQRLLRVRVVVHAGEVHYDANGCFGEALDVAFRLLDASQVKRALLGAAEPLILVVSGDIYRSVVRHGYDGIDQDPSRVAATPTRPARRTFTPVVDHVRLTMTIAPRSADAAAAASLDKGLPASGDPGAGYQRTQNNPIVTAGPGR
jgi:class 3 adenylate cyclase